MYFIGTAGWSVPRAVATRFPTTGTHLQRYSSVLNCVEINSSFYRAHSVATYRRWADSTPDTFKFAVKVPREITHDAQLRRSRPLVQQFLSEVNGLGKKLGPLLVQLPPSIAFDARVVARFFAMLREMHKGPVACEPRHKSWFDKRADNLLKEHRIARVAADPPIAQTGDTPDGDVQRLVYYRLHGSPRIYWSNYSQARLVKWAQQITANSNARSTWIIFDNTAAGCAASNALQLRKLLEQ